MSINNEDYRCYLCEDCGYNYDPEIGDEEHGVPSDTPFDDLPDDWECPNCGADKSDFYPL